MDREAVKAFTEISPELKLYLQQYRPPQKVNDIQGLRESMKPLEDALDASPPPEGVEEFGQNVVARDDTEIQVRIHRPTLPVLSGSPLIVYFHAGGYCVGSSALGIPLCRSLVARLGAVCVNVEYRLAPEHAFPTPVNDCWDALKWAAQHAVLLKADPTKGFIVAGESSGGNAAAVCAHLARNSGLSPPLTGQFLSVPACLPVGTVPDRYKPFFNSWDEDTQNPVYNLDMTTMLRENYAPDVKSPLYATFNDPSGHTGLPPAYFQLCGVDPVRDEGLIYEKVLREEHGIATKLDIYPGMPHAFWQVFPALDASKKAKEDMITGFGWLLDQ